MAALKPLQNKSIIDVLNFCKNFISKKILVHKLQVKMVLPSQIAGLYNYQSPAKFWFTNYRPRYSCPVRLHDFLIINISGKNQSVS